MRAHLLATGLLKEVDCPISCLEDCEAIALTNCGYFVRQVAKVSGTGTGELSYDASHPAFQMLIEALANESGVPEVIIK